MKIVYMVIEYSGEYEDYQERICGAYFSEEKAQAKIAKLKEAQEKDKCQFELCQECPANDWTLSRSEFEKIREEYSTYCPYIKDVVIDENEDCYCSLSCFYFEEAGYFVKTVEVEE